MSGILTRIFSQRKLPYFQDISRPSLWLLSMKYCKQLKHIIVCESELEEKFVRGFGKGGQKVNKTSNCVELKHLPTGITVKVKTSTSCSKSYVPSNKILRTKQNSCSRNTQGEAGLPLQWKRQQTSKELGKNSETKSRLRQKKKHKK